MATAHDELKQRALELLEELPDEALAEVVTFLDYQRFKLDRAKAGGTPYRPVALEGLWSGVELSEEDIEQARRDMWSTFGRDLS